MVPSDIDKIIAAVKNGNSFTQIAEQHGVSIATISRLAQKNGLRSKHRCDKKQLPYTVIQQFLNGESAKLIGKQYSVSANIVRKYLSDHNICHDRKIADRNQNILDLANEGHNNVQIAERVGCSAPTVAKILKTTDFSRIPPQLENKRWLASQYEKKSAKKIAQELECSYKMVRKMMKEHQIKLRSGGSRKGHKHKSTARISDETIRKISKLYSDGKSMKQVASELEIHVDTVKRHLNSEIRPSWTYLVTPMNHHYFDSIDDEHKAYWLGFLAADGHVSPDKNLIKFSLAKKDEIMVKLFADDIEFLGETYERVKNKNGKQYYECVITFHSPVMSGALVKAGLHDWKSGDPRILHELRPSLVNHFVRGLFDGDGSLVVKDRSDRPSKMRYFIICDDKVNIKIFDALEDVIVRHANVTKLGVKINNTTCRIRWNGARQVERIGRWLYNDATIYMERKKIRFPNHDSYNCGSPYDVYHYDNWREIFKDKDECFKWLADHKFEPPQYNINSMNLSDCLKSNDPLNVNYPNRVAMDIIRHFSPHIWYSSHAGYVPISAAWDKGNRSVLKYAFNMCWDNRSKVNIYALLNDLSKYAKDFASVSIFKPWIARYVYDKLLPDGGTIIDPCMGWGGRLLGTMGSNLRYIGYDLNPNVIESHNNMYEFVRDKLIIEPQFILADAAKIDWPDGDLLFTSPPYDDAEYYHGLPNGCHDTTPIYINIMKFKGKVALNVPKWHRDKCISIAKDNGRKLVDEFKMRMSSFMGRKKTHEPILVFI